MNNPFQDIFDRLVSIESSLAELKQSTAYASPAAEAELLDVAQAAKLLRLTTQTIYDKIHHGALPHVKQGNRIYFFKDELMAWLRSGRQNTGQDVEQQTQTALDQLITKRQRKRKNS